MVKVKVNVKQNPKKAQYGAGSMAPMPKKMVIKKKK